MTQTYSWEHWDDPNIKNVAEVAFTDDGLTATGTQHGNGYHATWTLDAAEEWITRRVTVEVQGDGWARTLKLTETMTVSGRATPRSPVSNPLISPPLASPTELNSTMRWTATSASAR